MELINDNNAIDVLTSVKVFGMSEDAAAKTHPAAGVCTFYTRRGATAAGRARLRSSATESAKHRPASSCPSEHP